MPSILVKNDRTNRQTPTEHMQKALKLRMHFQESEKPDSIYLRSFKNKTKDSILRHSGHKG